MFRRRLKRISIFNLKSDVLRCREINGLLFHREFFFPREIKRRMNNCFYKEGRLLIAAPEKEKFYELLSSRIYFLLPSFFLLFFKQEERETSQKQFPWETQKEKQQFAVLFFPRFTLKKCATKINSIDHCDLLVCRRGCFTVPAVKRNREVES